MTLDAMNRSMQVKAVWLAACIALSAALGGCDLLSPGGATFAGVVVDAETGVPIEGIQMSLKIGGSGFGNYVIVAETLTDSEGRFRVKDPGGTDRPGLYVNSPGYVGDQPSPYNPLYTSGLADYRFENRHNIRIELRRGLD